MINQKSSAIAQQYRRVEFVFNYFMGGIIVGVILTMLLFLYAHVALGCFSAFILFMLSIAWVSKIKPMQEKLQQLEEWKIPYLYLQQLKEIYPQLDDDQIRWIVEGFKDYLAMHIWEKRHLVMPSQAVDQLWHILLTNHLDYQMLCKQLVGSEIRHVKYDEHDHISIEVQQEALLETWRLSCQINRLDAKNTSILPRLFAVDYVLEFKHDPASQLQLYKESFKKYQVDHQSSSCGGGGCGGD